MHDHMQEIGKAFKNSSKDHSVVAWELIFKFGRERDLFEQSYEQLKQERDRLLDILAEQGGIFVIRWTRDCDCCESTTRHRFASREEFEDFCKRSYEPAEGPFSIDIVTRKQYKDFVPTFRDRVMEAFENGNIAPYRV